jgi:hypothetical protein
MTAQYWMTSAKVASPEIKLSDDSIIFLQKAQTCCGI